MRLSSITSDPQNHHGRASRSRGKQAPVLELLPRHARRATAEASSIRDASGKWFLLAFRSVPNDKEKAKDFVDVHPVEFSPFRVEPKLANINNVFFKPGDTSFASTGTHYVEKSGRLLISSSYRWSEDEGPGGISYVSRVDECPS